MDSTFLNTLLRKPVTHTPIWLMRQAGRYLPEYRKIREQAGSFLSLCKNPELATEVTLQPIRRFNFDAAILFSDILVVPEAMGLRLFFNEGSGPCFANTINSTLDIDCLKSIIPNDDLGYVMQIIKNLKTVLPANLPLIGFSGSPWTLACYMIEGKSSKNYELIKDWVYTRPQALHELLVKLSIAVADYLVAQIRAGVDTIMIFDSWGGILAENKFLEFSHKYLAEVLRLISLESSDTKIPIIVFTKGGGIWLSHLNELNCTALGIDWTIAIESARGKTNKILQGNLDPVILSVGDRASIYQEVELIINSYKHSNNGNLDGLIFNLGHGILPTAKPDNVAFLVDTVHKLSQKT